MGITKDATKPRKIPQPINIYMLLDNGKMRNLKMSTVSLKKTNNNKTFDCWNILIHEEVLKKLFWSMPTHMPAPKHLWDEIISSRSWQPLWDWKNSDKSAPIYHSKKCIRQWITFPYVFRDGVCACANTHSWVCIHAECTITQFLCIVHFSLGLGSTESRRATKAGKQSFPQLVYYLTPSWSGTETGEQCKAQKQFLCSQ